jgi:hypothetical protein
MRHSKWFTARTDSLNSLEFEFPYRKDSDHAHLQVQVEPTGRKEIAMEIDKGQFLCNGIDGCTIAVKFDDGPIKNIHANASAAGKADVIFPSYSILPQLKKAKKVVIEADFYDHGSEQIVFNTDGLRWEH